MDASSIVDKQQNEQNESHLEELKSQENHKSIIKSPSESTTQQKKVLKAIQNVDKSEESDSTYSASETSDGDDEPLSMLLISKMKKSEKLSKAVWKVEEKQANKKRNPKKLQKFKKKKKKVAKDASSKDEYFLCKMDICKRPSGELNVEFLRINILKIVKTGSKVAWVQCDECNKWFHIACLGLQKAQILPTDDFNCCSHQKPVKME